MLFEKGLKFYCEICLRHHCAITCSVMRTGRSYTAPNNAKIAVFAGKNTAPSFTVSVATSAAVVSVVTVVLSVVLPVRVPVSV